MFKSNQLVLDIVSMQAASTFFQKCVTKMAITGVLIELEQQFFSTCSTRLITVKYINLINLKIKLIALLIV